MRIPHPFPYQGSKRNLAQSILRYFPSDVQTLYEPFAGSAAISIAAACKSLAKNFVLNDLNEPLIRLWTAIVNEPDSLSERYAVLWSEQDGRERDYYKDVRGKFNDTRNPEYLLYLLARCVKASVRYNSNGEFNQSPDNRRKGMHPATMSLQIQSVSRLLKGKVRCESCDYKDSISTAKSDDLVYLDPPYQGVSNNRDARYLEGVNFDDFVSALSDLNERNICYIVSYDGRTGDKVFGEKLPNFLELDFVELPAGRSTQSTLLGGSDETFESLYISRALAKRLKSSQPLSLFAPIDLSGLEAAA